MIDPMKLSVIIPAYNEASTIESLVRSVLAVNVNLDKELVLVDDGSTDGTRAILKKMQAKHPELKIILHEGNQGKGMALQTGFHASTGDIVLIQDADLEYDPNDYPALLAPILSGKADVVFGSRFLGGGAHRVIYFWHSVGNKFLTMFSNMMTNLNLTDIEVGYKVFKREILQSITLCERHFGFEVEITAKVARQHCRIYEVPISYYGRDYAEGKKITWKDGVHALWCIFKYRFV